MKFLIGAFVLVLLFSCSKPEKAPYLSFKTTDSISRLELQYLKADFSSFDTARVDANGIWHFRRDSIPFGFYQIVADGKALVRFVLEDRAPGMIEYKTSGGTPVLMVRGNQNLASLWQVEQHSAQLAAQIDSIATFFNDSISSQDFKPCLDSLLLLRNAKIQMEKEALLELYNAHRGSLLQMAILMQKSGSQSLFNPLEDSEMFFETARNLKVTYPKYLPVMNFIKQTDSLAHYLDYTSVTQPGSLLSDFSLPNAWGEMVPMSRFAGKDLLLVVWSASCADCRKINKELMANTRPYRHRGLEIVMISMDRDADIWKTAIKEDNLPVWHLNDLRGEESPVWQHLGCTLLPFMLVCDKSGTITARSEKFDAIQTALSRLKN